MTFLAWLKQQLKRHDLVGDLARDVYQDDTRPSYARELHQWWSYLESCSACEGAYRALKAAWREYRSEHPRRRKPKSKLAKVTSGILTLRFRILKRDGYRCQLCGATAQDGVKLEIDHKVPKSKGGPTVMENLWALCFPCNRGKGATEL